MPSFGELGVAPPIVVEGARRAANGLTVELDGSRASDQ
jgi:hypothetical protein